MSSSPVKRKALPAMVAALMGLSLILNPVPAHASASSNNVEVGSELIRQFRFEKTLDMTNAPDRTRVPRLFVPFILSEIPEGEEEKYGIGKFADSTQFSSIKKGGFKQGKEAEWEVVAFSPDDAYDERLTYLLDNHPGDGPAILNHAIKYDWGGMTSSDHIQTAQASFYTGELGYDFDRRGWPEDTIAWRCFNEGGGAGSYDDGCQCLLDFYFSDFKYSELFNLHQNPAVTYRATAVQRPLFTHKDVNADRTINSVSKSLWRPWSQRVTDNGYNEDGQLMSDLESLRKAYKKHFLQDDVPTFAELSPKLKDVYTSPDEGKIDRESIRRYLLREGKPTGEDADLIASNDEVKIVDIGYPDDKFMIFDSVEEADAYYARLDSAGFAVSYDVLPSVYVKPVSFVNRYKPKISVSKVDEKGESLAGAGLAIVRKGSEEVVASWTSDAGAKDLRLDEGDYVLKETKAPEGYDGFGEFGFHVDKNGLISAAESHKNVTVDGSSLRVKNVKIEATPKDNPPKDEPKKPSDPPEGPPNKPSGRAMPKTGEGAADSALYAGLMAVSGAVLLGAGALRGRKEEHGK
ncbi:prealbumin-like fold domain-containing protein [Eggerthellaceae bacterium zg-1084]|uniref:MSCRAMM family protein n=1 Tax=Berryella wangjianweii TaxID=2734634 RepID=UPI0015560840|nr:prealbumin-like fold domain-containing protein [Berryella wangjianweii]NPD30460.1 prealbumin-like fold domain-containing protein [Berryella wangjianweii]